MSFTKRTQKWKMGKLLITNFLTSFLGEQQKINSQRHNYYILFSFLLLFWESEINNF